MQVSDPMTPDEMEAETYKYADLAFWILPLSSGKLAVLSPRRNVWGIADDLEGAKFLAKQGYDSEARVRSARSTDMYAKPRLTAIPGPRVDLSKFGL